MKSRSLGKTGIKVSEIGFGGWALGGGDWGAQSDADSLQALERAAEMGVTFIDTAQGYGDGRSEKVIARFLKGRSKKAFVATKASPAAGDWPPSPYDSAGLSYPARYLRENVEERLRNLDVDCLDLLQLHTWTRAWNRNPEPLETLRKLKQEGKIRCVGVSTPEQDQNCVIDLMRGGLIDAVQIIYNLFDQEPAAELLPVAAECGVGIIVRVVFDEGALTGKFTRETRFPEGDFRGEYFRGQRLGRVVERTERIKADLSGSGYSLPQAALKFALSHPAVSTVIPGMRNSAQAEANIAVADLPEIPPALMEKLRLHNWRRSIWYPGNW